MHKEIRQRIIWGVLAARGFLIPFAAGVLGLLTTTALFPSFSGALLSVALALTGLGVLAHKFCFGLDDIAKEELRRMREERELAFESRLDDLDTRLRKSDRDAEPEAMLEELRLLRCTLMTELTASSDTASYVAVVEEQFGAIFDRCVEDLERTITFHAESTIATSRKLKEELKSRREELKASIRRDVDKLREVVDQLRGMHTAATSDREALRRELDSNLTIALRAKEIAQERLGRIRDKEMT